MAAAGRVQGRLALYDRLSEERWARLAAKWIFRLALIGVWIGLWELLPATGVVSEVTLPPPSQVADVTINVVGQAFWGHFTTTLKEALGGFVIGAGSAFAMAVALTLFPALRFFLTDYILALQALPKVLLIPILIAWFGQDQPLLGIAPQDKIILAALIAFFPVYVNAMVGMNRIEKDEGKLMRTLEATRVQRLYMLQIPKGMPTIFAGFKNGATNAPHWRHRGRVPRRQRRTRHAHHPAEPQLPIRRNLRRHWYLDPANHGALLHCRLGRKIA